MSFRRGQAMLETALAVLFITVLFLVVFQVAHMVTTKILLDHAAARAARAKPFRLLAGRGGILKYAGLQGVPALARQGEDGFFRFILPGQSCMGRKRGVYRTPG